jgi:hypothetical protein
MKQAFLISFFISLVTGFIPVIGGEVDKQGEIEHRLAKGSDVDSLLLLMDEAAFETDKVLVLPGACRRDFLQNLIDKGRLFVSVVDNQVVATKKLFLTENAEKDEILHELRCVGEEARLAFRGRVNQDGSFISTHSSLDIFKAPNALDYGVCMYDGFDYTKIAFRGRRVNKALFDVAFKAITRQVKVALRISGQKNITLLYGVTYPNAGKKPGEAPDRMSGIAEAFRSFIKSIDMQVEPIVLEHSRYHTSMPIFDLNSQECKPLPKEKWIPGFGCILTYELKDGLV